MLINQLTRKPFRFLREFDNPDAYDIGVILRKIYWNGGESVQRFLEWFDSFKDTLEMSNLCKELEINIYS